MCDENNLEIIYGSPYLLEFNAIEYVLKIIKE
jgi:transposase